MRAALGKRTTTYVHKVPLTFFFDLMSGCEREKRKVAHGVAYLGRTKQILTISIPLPFSFLDEMQPKKVIEASNLFKASETRQ